MKKKNSAKPTIGIAEVRFFFTANPWIHPDDAAGAIEARFKQKLKERIGTITPVKIEEVAEDFVLASLSNMPPEGWGHDVWQGIRERVQNSLVGNFWERLKRKRVLEFTPGDIFMLSNWRVLRNTNPVLKSLPELQAWRPRAAMEYMRLASNKTDGAKTSVHAWSILFLDLTFLFRTLGRMAANMLIASTKN